MIIVKKVLPNLTFFGQIKQFLQKLEKFCQNYHFLQNLTKSNKFPQKMSNLAKNDNFYTLIFISCSHSKIFKIYWICNWCFDWKIVFHCYNIFALLQMQACKKIVWGSSIFFKFQDIFYEQKKMCVILRIRFFSSQKIKYI